VLHSSIITITNIILIIIIIIIIVVASRNGVIALLFTLKGSLGD